MSITTQTTKPPTVCLNMIVKNESKIIRRLIDSVVGLIDCYCICDTGSTDETVNIIKEHMETKGIPGKVITEPFKNFCYNRTFSLRGCEGMSDYILFLDADMILIGAHSFDKTSLTADAYQILQGSESFFYHNTRIIRNKPAEYWYECVTHEYVRTPEGCKIEKLSKAKLFINDIGDGGCKSDKFERDVRLLTQGIIDEPQHTIRYHFYLANSYYDLHRNDEAIETYRKRIALGGWNQEVWYSYYRIGLCYKRLNRMPEAVYAWLDGYDYLPTRLENVYEVCDYYCQTASKHKLASVYHTLAIHVLQTIAQRNINIEEFLFLNNDVYQYELDYTYSILACYLGVKTISSQLVTIFNKCNNWRKINTTLSNMKFYQRIPEATKVITFDSTERGPALPSGPLAPVPIVAVYFGTEHKFISSSLSLIPYEKNSLPGNDARAHYIACVRLVNYRITPEGGYTGAEKYDICRYKHVLLGHEFKVISETMIEPPMEDRHYIGAQDVKIYRSTTGKLLFTGTGYHQNNKIGVVVGDYDAAISTKTLECTDIKPSFTTQDCEKNWVYVQYKGSDHMIYNWHPLTIGKVNKKAYKEQGYYSLDLVAKQEMPGIFKLARGSTNGYSFEGEIWFVVHLVSYEKPRHYYHLIAVFDLDLKLKYYTPPFKFQKEPIEYCLGLIVERSRVIATFSVMDRTSSIGVYSRKELLKEIVNA